MTDRRRLALNLFIYPGGHHEAAVLAHGEHEFQIGAVQLFPFWIESIAGLLPQCGLCWRLSKTQPKEHP